MESFGLQAPIKAQLEAILQDYPAGQILSEGLQNAEDGRASRFSLMLDLREHSSAGLRHPNLGRCCGPAFVLADNGDGFNDGNWRSLQNLHQSEKRYSPKDIGRYGMGSRSYFHFADIVSVVSRKRYVGLDPLRICDTDGWSFPDLMLVDGVEADLFQIPEFSVDIGSGFVRGAIFRLPLRLGEHVEGGLGPEIAEEHARKLVLDWAESLSDGRLLLFLAFVRTIDVWIWERHSDEPTLVGKCEVAEKASMFTRLPPILPSECTHSFPVLTSFLKSLELPNKSDILSSIIKTSFDVIHVTAADVTHWLVVQRFAANNAHLVGLMNSCGSVPIIGVALPLGGCRARGAAFTFLPIGDLSTGLPIHINGSFQVLKNRRSIWLDTAVDEHSSLGNIGQQRDWAQWNKLLLREELPELWLDALENLVFERGMTEAIDGSFPWLGDAHPDWFGCAEEFYKRLRNRRLLCHRRSEGHVEWVQPVDAAAVLIPDAADDVFFELRGAMDRALSEHVGPSVPVPVVVFPEPAVQKACLELSGLTGMTLLEFLKLAVPHVDASKLAPLLILLAEYGGRSFQAQEHSVCKEMLSTKKWVHSPARASIESAFLADMFEEHLPHLADFHILKEETLVLRELIASCNSNATRVVDEVAIISSLRAWGMKTELTWPDVVREAQLVEEHACVASARRLAGYLNSRYRRISAAHLRAECSRQLASIRFVVAKCPDGREELSAPKEIFHHCDRGLIGEAFPTEADGTLDGLDIGFRCVDASALVDQIKAIARHGENGLSADVTNLVLIAFKKIISLSSERDLPTAISALRDFPWVPQSVPIGSQLVHLKTPCRIVQTLIYDMSPFFERLNEQWRAEVEPRALLAAGIEVRPSIDDLISGLADLQGRGELNEGNVASAAALANELATQLPVHQQERPSSMTIFVPTMFHGMQPAGSVYINDAPMLNRDAVSVLHDTISERHGRALGCTSARDELARMCEDDDENFQQFEDLPTRIRGLLNDYDNPGDIFVEHWQNCDDAGASSVQFVLDCRRHDCRHLVDSRASSLQGPALILQSSKALTAVDIERIQRLGASGKKADFHLAGRFGVGLNCMYHFSDTPQLLANGYLHIFDPLHKAVTAKSKGGKRFKCDKLNENFSSMLAPFDLPNDRQYPTVFRLPLRSTNTNPDGFGPTLSLSDIRSYVENFQSKVTEMVVFSKYVREVRIIVRSERGLDEEVLCVRANEGDCHRFMQQLPSSLEELVSMEQDRSSISTLTVECKVGFKPSSTIEWLVSHSLKLEVEMREHILSEARSGKAALLPHGAVALQLGCGKYDGNVACYYPMGITVGAPLLLHGCFSLPSSRKSIPLSNGTTAATSPPGHVWNRKIIGGPMSRSLFNLLVHVKDLVSEGKVHLDTWYDILELADNDTNKASKQLRDILFDSLWRSMTASSMELFPVVRCGAVESWKSSQGPFRCDYLLLSSEIQDSLVSVGMPLRCLRPSFLKRQGELVTLNHKNLCGFLECAAGRGQDLTPLHKWVVALLKFVLSSCTVDNVAILHGVPLLRLHSNEFATFGVRCFFKGRDLLPHAPQLFLHKDIKSCIIERFPKARVDEIFSKVSVATLSIRDVLPHKDILHQSQNVKDAKWLEAFWQFALSNKADILGQFGDWELLRVCGVGGKVNFLPISEAHRTYSIHNTDPGWRQDVTQVLSRCGVHILRPDLDALTMQQLLPIVHSNDEGFFRLLTGAHVSQLLIEDKALILSFSASRKRIDDFAAKIKSLPLFRLATSPEYVAIDKPKVRYFSLCPDDPFAEELMTLCLPNIVFLGWPLESFRQAYVNLKIKIEKTSKFVVDELCPLLTTLSPLRLEILDKLVGFVCKNKDREVIAALKSLPFVEALSPGRGLAPPSMMLASHLRVAKAFDTVLGDTLPAPSMQKYSEMLDRLDIRRDLTFQEVLLCAQNLHQTVEIDKLARDRSIFLVEELSKLLYDAWSPITSRTALKASKCTIDINSIKKFRIFVATDDRGERAAERVRHCEEASTNDLATLVLRSLSEGLVTKQCGNCSFASYCVVQHPLEKDLIVNHFERLCKDFSALVCDMGIFTDVNSLPTEALVNQWRTIVFAAPSFSCSSGLHLKYQMLMSRLESRLQVPVSSSAVSLQGMAGIKCIPIEVTADASGVFDGWVRFEAVNRVFFTLPQPFKERQSFFFEAPSEYKHVLRALGVAASPTLLDWAQFTLQFLDKEDNTAEVAAFPNERNAIEMALDQMDRLFRNYDKAEHLKPIAMCLIDEAGYLAPASSLVWPDDVSLIHRCQNLSDFGYKLVDRSLQFESWKKLCKLSELSLLSERVREVICGNTVEKVEPNDFERFFQDFLKSDDFCNGLCCAMSNDAGQLSDRVALSRQVQDVMTSLGVVWAKEFATELTSTDGKVVLAESRKDEKWFLLAEGGRHSLVIAAGNVGDLSADADIFLSLTARLNSYLHANQLPIVEDCRVFTKILELWKQPDRIGFELEKMGIRVCQSKNQIAKPGMMVPRENFPFLRQDFRYAFCVGEMVALRAEVDGNIEFRYAEVCPTSHASNVKLMGRQYLVVIDASGQRETRSHGDIYKELRREPTVEMTSASDHRDEAPKTMTFRELFSSLREMETLDESNYKNYHRRLALCWHPDKCRDARATQYMALINQHRNAFLTNKNFKWMDDIGDELPHNWADTTDVEHDKSTNSFYQQNTNVSSWQDDIRRERELFAANSSNGSRPRPHAGAPVVPTTTSASEPRIVHTQLSDIWWDESIEKHSIAVELCEQGKWAGCMFHCQQAIEMMIKSMMLCNCGITTEEMKGKGAHNLIALLSPLIHDSESWPVDRSDLLRISDAYLRSRYPPFPPNGDFRPPSSLYDSQDARAALDAAGKIRLWAESKESLRVPRPRSSKTEKGPDEEEPNFVSNLSLEPALLPPPPPSLPSGMNVPLPFQPPQALHCGQELPTRAILTSKTRVIEYPNSTPNDSSKP